MAENDDKDNERDIWGNPKRDIQGNEVGRDIYGNPPGRDIFGNRRDEWGNPRKDNDD